MTKFRDCKLNPVEILIIVFYSCSPFLYLIRVFFGDQDVFSVVLRLFEPLLILTTFFCLLLKQVKLNYYAIIQSLILFWGVCIGLLSKNYIFNIVSGASHFIAGLLVYIYFFNMNKSFDRMLWFLERLSYFVIIAIGIVIAFIYYSNAYGRSVYLGLACQILIPVFFVLCYKKKLVLAILCFLLIVLSGKRGVLLSFVLGVLAVAVPLAFSRYFNFKYFMYLLGGVLLVTIFVSLGLGDGMFSRLQFDGSRGINEYSSGRYQEFYSATIYWLSDSFRTLWGAGFGFTYTYIYDTPNLSDVQNYKNVHFSYLNPLISFGLFFGGVYLLSFAFLILGLLVKLSYCKGLGLAYKASIITFCIYACFVFNLFNEPIFWAVLGSLSPSQRMLSEEAAR
ncbi:O-antigen ligase family protein [Eionea flava]